MCQNRVLERFFQDLTHLFHSICAVWMIEDGHNSHLKRTAVSRCRTRVLIYSDCSADSMKLFHMIRGTEGLNGSSVPVPAYKRDFPFGQPMAKEKIKA